MIIATFSQLRNQAKRYFDAVEKGEVIEIYRNGKPIATLNPIRDRSLTRWKSARPIKLSGVSLSKIILSERSES